MAPQGRGAMVIDAASRAEQQRRLLVAPRHGRVWRRDARRRRLLGGADVLAVAVVTVGSGVTFGTGLRGVLSLLVLAGVALVAAKFLGLYDRDHRVLWHTTPDELPSLITWSAFVTLATMVVERAADGPLPSAVGLVVFASGLVVVAAGLRIAARRLWRQTTSAERVVLIGSGALEEAARRKFQIFGDLHIELVGTLHEDEAFAPSHPARTQGVPRLNGTRLDELAARTDRILVAATTVDEHLVAELVPFCRHNEIKLGLIPPARGMFGTAVLLDHLAELPIVQYNSWDVSRTTVMAKRILDVAVAGVGTLVLLPALPVVAVLIRLDSRGPVFFRQQRGGRNGQPFAMLKFRTMVVDAEARLADLVDVNGLAAPVFKLQDDPRVTRFGRFLRRTSLDEVPQLWNVLTGSMSLVGPRPEQLDLVERYPPEVREVRLAVRPGLTGPMQVSGRGALTFEERLAVEREYVENLSLARDFRVLGRTASAVFTGRGAS